MVRLSAAVVVSLAGVAMELAADVVVPNTLATTAGGGAYTGPLATSLRTYQWLIHSDQLTGMVGMDLTGIAYRLLPAASAAWPTADLTYTSYDIYLSVGVAPADRSLT